MVTECLVENFSQKVAKTRYTHRSRGILTLSGTGTFQAENLTVRLTRMWQQRSCIPTVQLLVLTAAAYTQPSICRCIYLYTKYIYVEIKTIFVLYKSIFERELVQIQSESVVFFACGYKRRTKSSGNVTFIFPMCSRKTTPFIYSGIKKLLGDDTKNERQ